MHAEPVKYFDDPNKQVLSVCSLVFSDSDG